MCDYSLRRFKNRLAFEGEHLVVHKFNSGSKGLVSPADLETFKPRNLKTLVQRIFFPEKFFREAEQAVPAICVPPGARLQLSGISQATQEKYDVDECENVIFTELTYEPFRYRDAFRFDNGAEVLIQRFAEGVRVEVLSFALEEGAKVEEPATGISYEQAVGRSVRTNA